MVLAECPSKDKLELLQTLEGQSLGELCVPCFLRAWGFYSRVVPTFSFLVKKVFPYGENPNKCTYFVGSSAYRGSLARVNRRVQDISI